MAAKELKGKRAFGIFTDGHELKFVELVASRHRIVLKSFKTVTLARKMEEVPVHEPSFAGGEVPSGSFDFTAPAGVPEFGREQESDSAIIAELLAGEKRYVIAHALAEPSIYYHVLESDFGLKGEKLRKRIMAELKTIRTVELASDAVDYLKLEEGGILCAVREDGMGLIRMLESARPSIGKRIPRIATYEPADVALANLVRANYTFAFDEVTVIAYIGLETSRLIFLKGNHLWHIAPMISEGADSPAILNTIYSRILLEQDNLAVAKVNRILFAGESAKLGAREFFLRQFREVEIDYLIPKKLDLSRFPPDVGPQLSEYAVPIASAWRALQPGYEKFYTLDLLPTYIREGQKTFKLGWHGYLLLLLLFVVTLFFTVQIASKAQKIKDKQSLLAVKQSQLIETRRIQVRIDSLNAVRVKYQAALALYDSLTPGANRWSKAISHLTRGVEDVNALWLTDLHSTPQDGMVVNGFSIYRSRIPRISNLFERSTLKQVTVQKIRDKIVYKYEFDVEKLED